MGYLNSICTSVLNIKAAAEQAAEISDCTLRKSRLVPSWNPKTGFALQVMERGEFSVQILLWWKCINRSSSLPCRWESWSLHFDVMLLLPGPLGRSSCLFVCLLAWLLAWFLHGGTISKGRVRKPVHLKTEKSNYSSTWAKDNSRLSCPEAGEGIKLKPSHPEQGPALNDLLYNCKSIAILKENIKIFFLNCIFSLKLWGKKCGNHMVKFFLK